MLFLLLRTLSVIGPIIYFSILRGLFYQSHYWLWWLALVVILNIVHFTLLWLRKKRNRVWLLFLYSEIFTIVGFFYILLLSNRSVVIIFTAIWSFVYLVLLESIFNYLYRTKKTLFIDLKSVTNYISLILSFILSFSLIYLHVFIRFPWWLAIFVYFVIIFIVSFNRFLFYSYNYKINILYAAVTAVVLVEFFGVLLWWPISIYVVSIIISVIFYFLSAMVTLTLEKNLTTNLILKYTVFSFLIIIVVLLTAQWI